MSNVAHEAKTEATRWTYEGYWTAVLGLGCAVDVVREFKLAHGLDEWLGTAEAEAARVGGIEIPEEWSGFHTRALAELNAAAFEVKTDPDDDDGYGDYLYEQQKDEALLSGRGQ